jgi:chitinase
MGREEIAALIAILQEEQAKGTAGHAVGTWSITYDKKRNGFVFNKCENDGYCEERPAVIGVDGTVIDAGGPLFG